ncbi:MAG: SMI1/KNR4 family protein [Betaproteobacteria bacterium]
MFNVTSGMEQAWRDLPKPKATASDIARIEGGLGVRLPQAYVDFVTRYGFVVFGRDPDGLCMFSHVVQDGAQKVTKEGDISFLFAPDDLMQVYRYMISADFPEDESRPMIPPGYLTVGSDAGHGRILLDVAVNPGQVLYWPDSPSRLGTDDNVALGFVADNFEDFINNLRSDRP